MEVGQDQTLHITAGPAKHIQRQDRAVAGPLMLRSNSQQFAVTTYG